MSAINDRIGHYRTISQTCYIANIAYLIFRVFYLILFVIYRYDVLIYYTAASIVFYLLCLFVIKKKKYYPYALLCGNEYFAFIIISTLFLGFSTGFHFYLLGLAVTSFFATYFSKTKNIKGSIFWGFLSLSIYLTLYFVTKNQAPRYAVEGWLDSTLFVFHIVLAFTFICFYLTVFTRYSLSLENKITNESRTDELTQLYNRYGLYDYFAQLDNKRSMALALFDIDNFKVINDTFGHISGDQILKGVAKIASSTLKDCFICRYGGEEFIIVLPKNRCFERLEEFRKNIEDAVFEYEGNKHQITITIGAESYQKDMSLEKWVKLADEKMYSGKKTGKNKVVYNL